MCCCTVPSKFDIRNLIPLEKNVDYIHLKADDAALSYACENGHANVVALLRPRHPNPHILRDKKTPLLWAAENGHAKVVSVILESVPDAISLYLQEYIQPLQTAIERGHKNIVAIFLSAYFKAGLTISVHTWLSAIYADDADIINLLLGNLLENKSYYLNVGLEHAVSRWHIPVVSLLLDAGADANWNDYSCLMYAAKWGLAELVARLIAGGADADKCNALELAEMGGHRATVKVLLDARLARLQE